MNSFLLVAAGGALGSVSRFGIGLVVNNNSNFPLATIIANISGCFLIGILEFFLPDGQLKYLIVPGFLGGFTTFSGFSNDFFKLVSQGNSLTAIGYVSLTVILCLFAVFAGNFLAKLLH